MAKNLMENHIWKGEPCPNHQKGWITDSRGNRLTRLGNRNAFGKLIKAHNQEIELMYHSGQRRMAEVREAILLADAAMSGSNMNMAVVERKVKQAIEILNNILEESP